jgi:hypothetical protein
MGARKTIYVGMAASGRARGPLWVDLYSTQPDLQRTALSIQHRTVPGHDEPVGHATGIGDNREELARSRRLRTRIPVQMQIIYVRYLAVRRRRSIALSR